MGAGVAAAMPAVAQLGGALIPGLLTWHPEMLTLPRRGAGSVDAGLAAPARLWLSMCGANLTCLDLALKLARPAQGGRAGQLALVVQLPRPGLSDDRRQVQDLLIWQAAGRALRRLGVRPADAGAAAPTRLAEQSWGAGPLVADLAPDAPCRLRGGPADAGVPAPTPVAEQ